MRSAVKYISGLLIGSVSFLAAPFVSVATGQDLPVTIEAEQMNSSFMTPSSVFDGGADANMPVLLKADEINNDQEL